MKLKLALAAAAVFAGAPVVEAQDKKCLACELLLTLSEQLEASKSGWVPTGANPDVTCKSLGYCSGACPFYANGTAWPVESPNLPTDGGAIDQRRQLFRLRSAAKSAAHAKAGRTSDAAPAGVDATAPTTLTREAAFAFVEAIGAVEEARGKPLDFYELTSATSKLLAAPTCNSWFNVSCIIDKVFNQHFPLIDSDSDAFAGPASFLSNGFRGGDWRGRDCDDNDPLVYPGRASTSGHPAQIDHNCNGIYGVDNSGASYEDLYCSGDNAPMGVAILGDSAAAHFHIPPQYFNARSLNLSGILDMASNEADWPACSWATGFRDTATCPNSFGTPMNSIYQRMWELNHCNHRDFQNIGVNGARTGSMAPPGIVNSLSRDPANDRPLLVFHALIGNDVCNGHPGSSWMTTVPEFTANVLKTLSYLDTVLPAGSHVAFIGLADGRVLYNTTHTRTHPIGIDYPTLYDVLSCSGSNPCWGWLNTDESWRNFTSDRAANLTAVYDTIIANTTAGTYKNFDMYRVNIDWVGLFEQYIASGQDPMNLIEPVDGFHPSQAGQQLLAQMIWTDLSTNRPGWLPKPNPYNAQIEALFGDQGGF